MRKKWILMILNIIFLALMTFIGINLLLNVDLLNSISLEGETNDFCQTYNKTQKDQNNDTLSYLACDNKFKKEKIILLLVDSLPFDKIYYILNVSDSKITNFFKGKSLDYKQSGALFETIFTGKFSRNYLASTYTKYDTLAQQFYNANMDVFYEIRYFPLGLLLNNNLMTKKEMHYGETLPLSRFCRKDLSIFESYRNNVSNEFVDPKTSGFRKNLNVDILYKKVDKDLKDKLEKMHLNYNECFSRNRFYSHVFYTDCLDHFIHTSSKNYPTVLYDIYFASYVIKEVIKWIKEEHDEYALAVISDHGGQYYYGEDALCNHGCNNPGNEAFAFVYTKDLGEQYEKYKINNQNNDIPIVSMNDFACIIAQSLKNVNLPLESNCNPRYIGNDNIIKFSSIKAKEKQLKVYIEKLCNKYPQLYAQYHGKYDKKLNDHKFLSFFKDIDSIYQAEDKIFDEYSKYTMKIQNELTNDVIKSGQTKLYYAIFYISLLFFIIVFFYFIRRVTLITKRKVLKEMKSNKIPEEEKILLKKMVRYIIIIIPILASESIICFIFHNSLNISEYINLSVFVKFFTLLFYIIFITYKNKLQKKRNFRKLIIVLISIIILHLFMHFIKFFSFIDKNVNTQTKSDFFKKYLSYPLILSYGILELYTLRNYYITKKCNIRYIYIVVPYLIFTTYFMIKFDLYIKLRNSFHPPPIIALIKKTYLMIFLLLLFIKPFVYNKNDNKNSIPNVIFNTKLFLVVMINFICVENERVIMIPLFLYVLFYLCYLFQKERDMFLKIIYLILIISYPQIHYIGNQGTYSMDSSIKITVKCPSRWADDLPIVMAVIFVAHKFKLYIISSSYLFSLYKRTKKNEMNYYNKLILYLFNIQIFALIICYLYFLKNEIEHSYIQLLFLIATKAFPLFLFEFNYLVNYVLYNILYCFNKDKVLEYETLEQIELNKSINSMKNFDINNNDDNNNKVDKSIELKSDRSNLLIEEENI